MRILARALGIVAITACARSRQEAPVAQWSLAEDLRIGDADTGKSSFTAITALTFDREGRIWLIDRQTPEIRIFSREGRFERVIGRAGEGPGEIVETNGFAITSAGLLWVPDYRLGRYDLFDTTGRFLSLHPDLIRSYGYLWNGGVDDRDRLYDQIYVRTDTSNRPALRRFRDTSLTRADTLPYPSCAERPRRYFKLEVKQGSSTMGIPFDANEVGALDPAGIYWCSGGVRPAAVAIKIDGGDTVARIEYSRTRIPVSPAARDSAITRITKMARDMGAQLPDFSRIPELQPAVIGVTVDDQGRVWLRVPDPTGTRFDLFDRTGKRVAEVATPMMLQHYAPLTIRGDTLLGVIIDADEVPAVVRLHLVRSPAPR